MQSADILQAVRQKLAQQNVFVFTSVTSATRQGDITDVVTTHTFVDGETGEQFAVNGYGQGQDKADMGVPVPKVGVLRLGTKHKKAYELVEEGIRGVAPDHHCMGSLGRINRVAGGF